LVGQRLYEKKKEGAKMLLRMEERKDRKRKILGRKRKVKKIYEGETKKREKEEKELREIRNKTWNGTKT